jgi:formate hydrogenlyase subunit 6/NADH:ubiquinone oxidoreductase subunit I
MATTFGRMLRPAVTENYPDEKRTLPERARMSFAMATDENDQPQCKACMLCERSCPDEAIKIESEKKADGPGRALTKFTIDLGKCMYCGLCVEQCSTDGLHHTGEFENNSSDRADMMLVLYQAEPGSLATSTIDESTPEQLAEVTDTSGAVVPEQGGGAS